MEISDKDLDLFNTKILNHIQQEQLEFIDFANYVLEDFMDYEPSSFVPLGEMHQEWWEVLNNNTFGAIMCGRGHLKTSFILTYCAFMMNKHPNFRAIYVSATLDQALNKLEQFEELIKRSFWLKHNIATGNDDGSWRRSAKQFKNGSRIQAASVGKSLEGPHVHLIILDDILQEFPKFSDEKVIYYIKRVVMPMRLPEGKITLVGTQKRLKDATQWVRESSEWKHIWHPALLENGTPRWPEYWTHERLMQEKQSMGTRAFESEYLLNPIDPESSLITWDTLKPCLDYDLGLNQIPKGWEILMGVDLAVGIDQQNDETSYCILAWNRDTQQRQLVYQWTGKVKAEGAGWLKSQVDNIVSLSARYNPTKIMIESNGFQRLVAHATETLSGLPVSKHNTGSEKHHGQIGIPNIALKIEQGLYTIPYSRECRKDIKVGTKKLTEGLTKLVIGEHGKLEGHTPDAVVSLWMCELAIQEISRKSLSFVSWEEIL
tara:strand:- start:8619 stop:10082 length:1464 start_codon:yes stop_codon:yes gene_type:complete